MGETILIWGAGAIGGSVGAYLVEAGHDVLFVDQAEEHVAALNGSGLHITGPIREFTVPARAVTPGQVSGVFETVFLATKSQHTRQAARQLAPHLAADGVVVSLQNGLNELEIADEVGEARTMGAFVNFGADYLEPGRILYGGRGAVVVGEMDGRISDRLGRVHELLLDFDADAIQTDNINGFLWAKLAYGAMLFGTALTNASIAEVLARPDYADYFVALAREVLGIAAAQDIRPEPFNGFTPADFLDPQLSVAQILQPIVEFNLKSAKSHSGIWRDLAVRKRKTEADSQLGPIVTAARRLGRTAPLTQKVIELIHEIEDGRLAQDWTTLDRAAAAGAERSNT